MCEPIAEAAWAAGFFDGEGWVGHFSNGYGARIAITQKTTDLLDRFNAYTGNLGQVTPFAGTDRREPTIYYRYTANRKEAVMSIYRQLRPYLGRVKLIQFETVLYGR